MDMHKGHLFVTSEGEGHGASFTLLLPIVLSKLSTLSPSGKSKFGSQQSLISHAEACTEPSTENLVNDSTAFSLNQTYFFTSNDIVIKSESANNLTTKDVVMNSLQSVPSTKMDSKG